MIHDQSTGKEMKKKNSISEFGPKSSSSSSGASGSGRGIRAGLELMLRTRLTISDGQGIRRETIGRRKKGSRFQRKFVLILRTRK